MRDFLKYLKGIVRLVYGSEWMLIRHRKSSNGYCGPTADTLAERDAGLRSQAYVAGYIVALVLVKALLEKAIEPNQQFINGSWPEQMRFVDANVMRRKVLIFAEPWKQHAT